MLFAIILHMQIQINFHHMRMHQIIPRILAVANLTILIIVLRQEITQQEMGLLVIRGLI